MACASCGFKNSTVGLQIDSNGDTRMRNTYLWGRVEKMAGRQSPITRSGYRSATLNIGHHPGGKWCRSVLLSRLLRLARLRNGSGRVLLAAYLGQVQRWLGRGRFRLEPAFARRDTLEGTSQCDIASCRSPGKEAYAREEDRTMGAALVFIG
jgi:hypothetical protein